MYLYYISVETNIGVPYFKTNAIKDKSMSNFLYKMLSTRLAGGLVIRQHRIKETVLKDELTNY